MGSGKTTIGRLLAHELGWTFADLDQDIEATEGASIAQIFDERGEAEFRRLERNAIHRRVREVGSGKPMVVALGGGTFQDENTRKLLDANGVTIWLDCAYPLICERVNRATHRPLARDREKMAQLYEERRAAYELAEHRIEIQGDDAEATITAIRKLPIF